MFGGSGPLLQRRYYARGAAEYESQHVREQDVYTTALDRIREFATRLDLSSLLDVGCGTGRAMSYFQHSLPRLHVIALDPVDPLIRQASNPQRCVLGVGERLPFGDSAFDATCALGVLHHVPKPGAVLREMMRVSRRAIFLSDANRFGQGAMAVRSLKVMLYRVGLGPSVNWLKTRGRGYNVSEGDGIYYSYSVFDSLRLLKRWADRTVMVPIKSDGDDLLLHASHLLVCALRRP